MKHYITLYTNGNRKVEHRAVAEQLGLELKANEEIHHIDGNKTNNDPRNLIVLDRAVHRTAEAINHLMSNFVHAREKVRSPRRALSDEEYELALELKLQGLSSRQIAFRLGKNANTVRSLLGSRRYIKPERLEGDPLPEELRKKVYQIDWRELISNGKPLVAPSEYTDDFVAKKHQDAECEKARRAMVGNVPYTPRSPQEVRNREGHMAFVRKAVMSFKVGAIVTRRAVYAWLSKHFPETAARVNVGTSLSSKLLSLSRAARPLLALVEHRDGCRGNIWRRM